MTGAELRSEAYKHIQSRPYLWGKWNDAREEYERQELMASVIALLVSEYCIAEMYANQSDIGFAIENIRREYEKD